MAISYYDEPNGIAISLEVASLRSLQVIKVGPGDINNQLIASFMSSKSGIKSDSVLAQGRAEPLIEAHKSLMQQWDEVRKKQKPPNVSIEGIAK